MGRSCAKDFMGSRTARRKVYCVGVTKKATASQASEFGKIFDPPAIPVEVGGGVSGEGMGFTISTKFAPLVLCTPSVGNVTTKVPVPVIPQTSANKKPGAR